MISLIKQVILCTLFYHLAYAHDCSMYQTNKDCIAATIPCAWCFTTNTCFTYDPCSKDVFNCTGSVETNASCISLLIIVVAAILCVIITLILTAYCIKSCTNCTWWKCWYYRIRNYCIPSTQIPYEEL